MGFPNHKHFRAALTAFEVALGNIAILGGYEAAMKPWHFDARVGWQSGLRRALASPAEP